MEKPSSIATRRVAVQYVIGAVDGPDADDEPDFIPARGVVEFTASVAYTPWPEVSGPNPMTVLNAKITGVLDDEGYLCTPHPSNPTLPGKRGVRLLCTDGSGGSVKEWTWTAAPKFVDANGTRIPDVIPPFSFYLPSDPDPNAPDLDLTTVVKVPASQGTGTAQAEALAALASAAAASSANSAETAVAAALDVKRRADAGEFKGEDGKEGAPGPNTVPTQEAVATAITSPGSAAAVAVSSAVGGAVFEATPPQLLSPATPITSVGTQAGHGWVLSGSHAPESSLNDTSEFALGSQSVKIVAASTSSASVERSGLNIDGSDSHLRVWLKVEDMSKTGIVSIYAFSNGLTGGNYYLWNIISSATPYTDSSYIRQGEWVGFSLPWSAATPTGTPSRDKIDALRFRATATTAGAVVRFNGFDVIKNQGAYGKGVVSLTFDDSNVSQYDTARPIMDKYGFAGTAYMLPGNVDGGANSMTMAQVRALHRVYGWEIGSHSSWGLTEHSNFPIENLDADLLRTRNWLKRGGFRGADSGAYPYGRITTPIVQTVSKYQYAGRASAGASNLKAETLPPSDPMRIRPLSIASTTTVASVTAAIDKAVAQKEWLVLIFHGIRDSADTYYYPVANFQAIIDYIAASGVAVRTVSDALAGANPVKTSTARVGSIPLRVAASDVAATIADGMPGYNLPDAATTNVYFAGVTLPDDAAVGSHVSLEYTWVSPTASSGSAFLRGDVKVLEANGSAATKSATTPPSAAAVPVPATANTTATTAHEYTQIPVTGTGQKYYPMVFRNGNHATDTATGDIRILDARLIYTKKAA